LSIIKGLGAENIGVSFLRGPFHTVEQGEGIGAIAGIIPVVRLALHAGIMVGYHEKVEPLLFCVANYFGYRAVTVAVEGVGVEISPVPGPLSLIGKRSSAPGLACGSCRCVPGRGAAACEQEDEKQHGASWVEDFIYSYMCSE
jgi:hypothetical protein